MAVNWDGIIIENPNNLVIANTTATLGGSRSNSFYSSADTVTFYFQNIADNLLNYREALLVITGINDDNYIDAQKKLLTAFKSDWRKTLFLRAGDIVSTIQIGSEELNLSVNKDVYFYVPTEISNYADYIEGISYTYAEGRSPEQITAPIHTGEDICSVRYRLNDGLTFDVELYAKNTVLSERSIVNHAVEIMGRYPELFITIAALFLLAMAISAGKIYWHFSSR